MTELQQILESSKLTAEKIEANLLHPVLNTTDYNPRDFFDEITDITDNYFNHKSEIRMLGLAGLRGVGKTTLLWQAADYIYKNYTKNIYFFHLGRLKKFDIGVHEIQEGIEKYFADGKLWTYKEKIVLLFDEIHEDHNWANDLKIFYDLLRPMFVIATGSSALLLQSTADLVSRMLIQHVYPLSFTEYIALTHSHTKKIREIAYHLQKVIVQSENEETVLQEFHSVQPNLDMYLSKIDDVEKRIYDYIVYHNITRFCLEQNKERVDALIADLIRQVIYEDIPKVSKNITNHQHSEKILSRIAASDEINIQLLSQSLGISMEQINENLDILEKAEFLNMLFPYAGVNGKISKMKKYFFMSPSVRKTILLPLLNAEKDIYAKMMEDTVVLYLKRIFRDRNIISFSSVKKQKNPDLIIETLPNPMIIEIGTGKQSTKQISNSKVKYKYGIMINLKAEKIVAIENSKTIILPLKYFLLL